MTAEHQFVSVVNDIYGLYLDCISGLHQWREKINNLQRETSIKTGILTEELDKRSFIYGKGDPNIIGSYPLHSTSQGEIKERIKKEGKDYYDIAALCLVLLYQYWEDHFREKIAKEHGVQKNKIRWDIMGDIRYLRESIIHHQGIAKDEVKNCRILKDFNPGKKISINSQQMENIISIIRTSEFRIIKSN